MEPVTHLLTGACLARTGLNRRAAYATAAMAIAAEFPDIDTLWTLRGPVSGFEHHRGITHTLLGIPFEAAFLLLCFYLFHAWRNRRPAGESPPRSATSERAVAPLHWGMLYLLLMLALLSHLLLDYTNNYGIRPFFPFNDRWYAGSIVFIFDPLLFLLLVAGLVLPSLFGLVGQEVGARRKPFRGRGWARAALAGVVLLWSVRWVEHSSAVALAEAGTLRAPGSANLPAGPEIAPISRVPDTGQQTAPADLRPLLPSQRSLASPDPLSIFRWYTATDFGPAYRIGVADSRLGTLVPGAIFVKLPQSSPITAAESSHLGRVYLDWSPMPILSLSRNGEAGSRWELEEESNGLTVTFRDPRFMGDTPLQDEGARPPLTGQVLLGRANQVLAEGIDGRFGR